MNNNEFILGLYDHNVDGYIAVKNAFESGKDIVSIVRATGTGKSYIALQLAYDNKDKNIVYVVPSQAIIEHIKKIIEDNPYLDLKRDFPNLEFRTYQSFVSLSYEEMSDINCDLLILDEFHHIGAPVWGERINTMIETHPSMKIFGMTAYTVRDRGTIYERDMANPETDELFSRTIESRYDLCDAMIDGVLPKPIYKSGHTNLLNIEKKLEERVKKLNPTSKEYKELMTILSDVKKRIHEAPSIYKILKKVIKQNGKYIYYCPPISEEGINDIETIKKQALEWFKKFIPEEDIIVYTSTSEMKEEGKRNREAFYNDTTLDGKKVDNKLRIMFAINQYNEGIHAPNIDGVIMGRGTSSDIVFFEQLGRALSVRGKTKERFNELEKYSIEELILMCKLKDIKINDNISKEELIEKLISPIIIDLTNNFEFIKYLENNLKERIKLRKQSESSNQREIKIIDASFDIEIEDQDLYEMLKYVSQRLQMSWDDYYQYAVSYYEYYGNLFVPKSFKTCDGYTYDENGFVNLGAWIALQRYRFNGLSEQRQQLLKSIGFIFDVFEERWQKNYELVKNYYEHYGNLNIPKEFKTKDGYTYDEDGTKLGHWIRTQRTNFHTLSEEKQKLLLLVHLEVDIFEKKWQTNYQLAKKYYEYHGNLSVPRDFKTNDGYTYDENGTINLGIWIKTQKNRFSKLSLEKQRLLLEIGLKLNAYEDTWQKNYELAKKYYEYHGDLHIPKYFKTNDGYTYDENGKFKLGEWLKSQKTRFSSLSSERQQLLLDIGITWYRKKK